MTVLLTISHFIVFLLAWFGGVLAYKYDVEQGNFKPPKIPAEK